MKLADLIANSTEHVIIPTELLLLSEHARTVYHVAALIHQSKGEDCFRLPDQDTLQELCGFSMHTLIAARRELHTSGWLREMDNGTKKSMRKLVLFKRIVYKQSQEASEGVQMPQSKMRSQSANRGESPIISIIVNFQPDDFLKHTHKTASKKDSNNNTLKDFPLEELWEQAGKPSTFDLTHAILETESFDTQRTKLINCLSNFISRFDENGKLRPGRKGILPQSQTKKRKEVFDTRGVTVTHEQCTCPIFPTQEIPADRIDDICKRLNAGAAVDISEYPRFRNMEGVVEIYDDYHVRLASIVKSLTKEKTGYWRVGRWQTLTHMVREVQQEERVS